MKKQSVQTALLALLLLGAAHGLAITVWRTVDYFTRFDSPMHAVWFLIKAVSCVGMLLIGFCVYQLIQAFRKTGYLTANSLTLLRSIGLYLVVIAAANSAFTMWQNLVITPKLTTMPAFGSLLSAFAFDFWIDSPAILLSSMLVFLLAAFVERALVIKSENEAFI